MRWEINKHPWTYGRLTFTPGTKVKHTSQIASLSSLTFPIPVPELSVEHPGSLNLLYTRAVGWLILYAPPSTTVGDRICQAINSILEDTKEDSPDVRIQRGMRIYELYYVVYMNLINIC
jgi:hypothetical protein